MHYKTAISVVMSVYNGQLYLKQAIDSILEQSFTDFEFIIIDDCSNDDSAKIIKEYSKKDNRIIFIQNDKRLGLGKNLQNGCKIASGMWIARMDADDISTKDRLQTQFDFAKENPDIDIIGSYAVDIDEDGNEIDTRYVPTSHKQIIKYIWTCPMIHPSVFIKSQSLKKVGSYGDEIRRQDYALWFRCAAHGLKFANINKILLKYRFTDSYFSRNNFKALLMQIAIGWKGCKQVKAPLYAYIGVTVPLIKGLMPGPIKKYISKILRKIDPRNK